MKSPTDAYKALKLSLRDIKVILNRVPLYECNTKGQIVKVKSYILLCHAAFEQYLERICVDVSNEAVEKFNDKGRISKVIVSMTAYETIAQIDDNISRRRITLDVAQNFQTFVNQARVNINNQVDRNHGVRIQNQKQMLQPIGVDPEETDLATANALDAFGSKRGEIAHTFRIHRVETRSSAENEVRTIFRGLRFFDVEACKNLGIGMTS